MNFIHCINAKLLLGNKTPNAVLLTAERLNICNQAKKIKPNHDSGSMLYRQQIGFPVKRVEHVGFLNVKIVGI